MENRYTPLTDAEAAALIKNGLCADPGKAKTKSIKAIVLGRLCNLYNLICFVVAAALCCVGSYKNMVFLPVCLCNTGIGIIQELRAKFTTEKMLRAATPTVSVIRSNGEKRLKWSEAVKGDTVRLNEGDTVCADCIVIEGEVECDTSALTGESETVSHTSGMKVESGSAVVSGSAVCVIEAVGKETRAFSITESTRRIKLKKSVIISKLNKIIKLLSFIIWPLAALYFVRLYLGGHGIDEVVTAVSSAVVGLIPSGLILLTSTSLAVSVVKLATKNVLVNEMNAIEMIARTDVICLDKTGTITTGGMKVTKVINFADEYVSLSALAACASVGTNKTAQAIKEYAGECKVKIESFVPFSSLRKYSAVNTDIGTFVLGAPEFLMNDDEIKRLGIDKLTDENRVICLCRSDKKAEKDAALGVLVPCCAVLLKEELRPGASDAINELQRSGVTVKVISGDNAKTVSAAAKQCGVNDADKIFDLSTVGEDADYASIAKEYTVFGRSTPEQKKKLIAAYKKLGHTVSMTGDGINDLPAMKESDCAMALCNGTDGSRSACDIVLSENGFDDIAHIIGEGRTVINNMSCCAGMFLTKTIFTLLITVIFLLLNRNSDIQPIQYTVVSVFTIGIPSFMLALIPDRSPIKGEFFAGILTTSLPAGLILTVSTVLLSLLGYGGSVMTYVLGALTYCVMLSVSRPFNAYKACLSVAMLIGFGVSVTCFGGFFDTLLTSSEAVACAITVGITTMLYAAIRYILRQVNDKKSKMRSEIHPSKG